MDRKKVGYNSSFDQAEDRVIAGNRYLDRLDRYLVSWMSTHGVGILRVVLGIVFVWFGALKFVPGLSPAEELLRNTVYFVPPELFQPILAVWEVAIGIGLLFGWWMRVTLALLFLQMAGTVLPLIVLPQVCWNQFPFVLTLEGQYIVKNIVLIAAGLVIGARVREHMQSNVSSVANRMTESNLEHFN